MEALGVVLCCLFAVVVIGGGAFLGLKLGKVIRNGGTDKQVKRKSDEHKRDLDDFMS